jgi:hypothetical protein
VLAKLEWAAAFCIDVEISEIVVNAAREQLDAAALDLARLLEDQKR